MALGPSWRDIGGTLARLAEQVGVGVLRMRWRVTMTMPLGGDAAFDLDRAGRRCGEFGGGYAGAA
jgi:hypothetical protein